MAPTAAAANQPPGAEDPWTTHVLRLAPGSAQPPYLEREWVLTNGTGAFAMGTVPAVNTRRYHGLLVAATCPPVGRVVALNQMLEQLLLHPPGSPDPRNSAAPAGQGKSVNQSGGGGGEQVLEFTNLAFRDPGGAEITAPRGHAMLRGFRKGLSAAWDYTWGQVRFTRELHLHWKEQSATLRYLVRLVDDAGQVPPAARGARATLRLAPMMTLRDFHALHQHNLGGLLRAMPDGEAPQVTVHRSGSSPNSGLSVTLGCSAGRWTPWRDAWWYNVHYRAEAERGQDCFEDYYLPGAFEVDLDLSAPAEVLVTVALGDKPALLDAWCCGDRARHLAPIVEHLSAPPASSAGAPAAAAPPAPAAQRPALWRELALAADDFVVDRWINRRQLSTILAGYPWFADWGRDTFIALPGLLLETGRFEQARAVLEVFAENLADGLVPNRFDDYEQTAAHYNTVDASLWFIRAAIEYLRLSGDRVAWDDFLAEACLRIMDAYIKGTRHGIRMAGDGLITAGHWQTQLTWMDAAAGGVIFTPRPGKTVEINALWYYALESLANLFAPAAATAQVADHYRRLADRIRRSFLKVFWDDARGYLADGLYVDEQGREHLDLAFRPNQILAVSLPLSPVPRTKQQIIVQAVRQRLLAPAGPRTLPPGDPHYHGRYTGGPFERDRAYHQGTIWPWLMGPWCEALLRADNFSPQSRQEALAALQPLLDDLEGRTLGQLHEIYEADADWEGRHRPVGCPAQAWSIAEVLRALRLIQG